MTIPVFGEKVEGVDYQARYGVYAVIPNPEQTEIILVQAPNGAWFLPGGEIEAGEDHQSALERELLEELGFTASIGQYFGQADEYFYSRHRDSTTTTLPIFTRSPVIPKLANPWRTSTIWPGSQLTKPLISSNAAAINGALSNGKIEKMCKN